MVKAPKDFRVVFMGTPEFAVPSLRIIVENGYNVVGVITATDKYGGRGGKQLIESDVKKYAVSQGLHILQPRNLKDPEFLDELQSLNADVQFVVAFRMLPEVVWNMPPQGTYNLHGSLLPKYRGAAPIHWAVINGDRETGVTSFKLKHEIDTGDLIFQERLTIGPDDTTGDMHDKMMVLGANTVLKTLEAIRQNTITFYPQDDSLVCKAPKIFHEDCEIDFSNTVQENHYFIRGMSHFPGAYTHISKVETKILKAKINNSLDKAAEIGTIHSDNKKVLSIRCVDGWIDVLELKMSGKKRMDIVTFLNGYKV